MHEQRGQNLDKKLKREVHPGPQNFRGDSSRRLTLSLGKAPVQTRTCIPAELQPSGPASICATTHLTA